MSTNTIKQVNHNIAGLIHLADELSDIEKVYIRDAVKKGIIRTKIISQYNNKKFGVKKHRAFWLKN